MLTNVPGESARAFSRVVHVMTVDGAISLKRETFSAGLGLRRWYVARNGESRGPLSDVELVWLAGDGSIAPEDFIWRPGYLGWTQADKIAGLLIPPDVPEGGSPPPADLTPHEPPPPPVAPPLARAAMPEATSAPTRQPDPPPAPKPEPPIAAAAAAAPPAPMPADTPAPEIAAAAEPADESLRALLLAIGTPSQPAVSYVKRHWRGELPLVWSFWVNGVLLTGPVVALCAWIIFSLDGATHMPVSLAAIGGAGLPSWIWAFAARLLLIPAIAIQVWCIVGIFRSACRREGMWGEVATATAVCSALCCTVFTLLMLRG